MLLEKGIEFEEAIVNLNGDQYQPEFLQLNPFHHIPVLVDEDFTLIESLAMMDYLDAKYPDPSFTPKNPRSLGIMRMLELVIMNELLPATVPLLKRFAGVLDEPDESLKQSHEKLDTILNFYQDYLGDRDYLVGNEITQADFVAGTAIPSLEILGFSLESYPKIQAWCDRLQSRESWQKTAPKPEMVEAAMSGIKSRVAKM
jgi:glutathione S-transferase